MSSKATNGTSGTAAKGANGTDTKGASGTDTKGASGTPAAKGTNGTPTANRANGTNGANTNASNPTGPGESTLEHGGARLAAPAVPAAATLMATRVSRPALKLSRFRVVPDRSVVLIEARSSVGPMRFGAIGLTGYVDALVRDGEICTDVQPTGHLEVALGALSSGNSLYDAELLRRVDARRFPRVTLDLTESTPLSNADRFRLSAEVTFHGVTRPLFGTVDVSLPSKHKLVVTGEQAFDIRDFEIASPTVLMLRIYPDVRVNLHVEAEREE
jgi:hypothetical protein